MTEAEIELAFADMHPRVLGALLSAVVTALVWVDDIRIEYKPRMADFTTWVVVAEPALGLPPGNFVRAYSRARKEAVETNIDTSTVGQWIRSIAEKGGATQTATDLYHLADDQLRRASDWPKNARALSMELRRLAPALRALGVDIDFTKESSRAGRRLVVINSLEVRRDPASDASPSSDDTGPEASRAFDMDDELVAPIIPSDASDDTDASLQADSCGTACPMCSRNDLCDDCLNGLPGSGEL